MFWLDCLSTISRYGFRYHIGPWSSSLHHQYIMEWIFSYAWIGMSSSRSILLPSFASLFASSLPMMVCALTLYRVVGASRSFSSFTIKVSIVLPGWLFCCMGCFI